MKKEYSEIFVKRDIPIVLHAYSTMMLNGVIREAIFFLTRNEAEELKNDLIKKLRKIEYTKPQRKMKRSKRNKV